MKENIHVPAFLRDPATLLLKRCRLLYIIAQPACKIIKVGSDVYDCQFIIPRSEQRTGRWPYKTGRIFNKRVRAYIYVRTFVNGLDYKFFPMWNQSSLSLASRSSYVV
jgi:hypothetical protein